jgi:hypothetical protein
LVPWDLGLQLDHVHLAYRPYRYLEYRTGLDDLVDLDYLEWTRLVDRRHLDHRIDRQDLEYRFDPENLEYQLRLVYLLRQPHRLYLEDLGHLVYRVDLVGLA